MSEHPNIPGYGAAARKYELAEDTRFDTVTCPKCGGEGFIPSNDDEKNIDGCSENPRCRYVANDLPIKHENHDHDCPLCEGAQEVHPSVAREYNQE